jgi:phage gpG-like protein
MEPEQGIRIFAQKFKAVMLRLPLLFGNEAVNFTLDNFRLQGFMGHTFQRWLPVRKGWNNKVKRGSILIGMGRLRRSIRITQLTPEMVAIGTDVKYARAHNEGMRIGVIQSVKGFSRKSGVTVSPHTRRINMNIPRRQYMGPSPYLYARLKRLAALELLKANRT